MEKIATEKNDKTGERNGAWWRQARIRTLQMVLGAGLSLLLLWIAFRGVPLSQVFAAFVRADYRFVILALALVLTSPLVRAARWKLLYHPDQKEVSILRLAEMLLIAQMLNIAIPARLGEIARIYFAGKLEGRNRARTLGAIAVEKWLDILMLLLLALFVPVLISLPPWFQDSRSSLAALTGAFFVLALLLSYNQGRLLAWVVMASRLLPANWRARVRRAVSQATSSLDVLRSPWVNLQLQGWSFLILLLSVMVNYAIFLAQGLALSFAVALFLLAVLELGVVVPSTPGKLGVFHSLCILALGVFGVEKGTAASYAVLLHLVVFVPPSLLGAFFLWREHARGVCQRKTDPTGVGSG